MQNFRDIEDLVAYMFEKLDGDDPISVIINKDLAISIMKVLLEYDNVVLDICDIDSFEYDREYLVSLYDEVNTDYWHVSVEQIYDYEKEMYFGTDGYVLFHENVNSKALIDMQNNEFIELSGYDWFTIGEDEEKFDGEPCRYNTNNELSGKCVEYSKDKDGDMHGFTASRSDGNSYYSYSVYTSDKLSSRDIQSLLKRLDFD